MSEKNPVTSKEFQEFAEFVGENFERVDKKIDRLDHKLDQKFDAVLTSLDGVVKELQAHREEDVMGAAQLRRHDDQLLDHEKRIVTLEVA